MRLNFLWSKLPAILCFIYVACWGSAFLTQGHESRIIEKLTPPQAESQAEKYVDRLRSNQFDTIINDFDPNQIDEGTRNELAKMASMFPAQESKSIKVVGVSTFRSDNLSTVRISLEYEFPDRWILATLVTQTTNGVQKLAGFHINQTTDSLEHGNRFTFAGKGVEQYAAIFLFLVDMGLALFALIVCARSKMTKENWFWPIICLLGVCRIVVNWTTGAVHFTPLWINIPPAGAASGFYSPWMIYASVPVGAALYLLRYSRQTKPIETIQEEQVAES